MPLADALVTMLWRNAVAAIPLALLVIAFCRLVPCRPSTRHALWLLVMGSLLLPPVIPQSWRDSTLVSAKEHISSASRSISRVATEGLVHVSHLASAAYSQFREKELPQSVDATPITCPDPSKKQIPTTVMLADAQTTKQPCDVAEKHGLASRTAPKAPSASQFSESPSAASPFLRPDGMAVRSATPNQNQRMDMVGSLNATAAPRFSSPVHQPQTGVPPRSAKPLPTMQQDSIGSGYTMSSPTQNLTSPIVSAAPAPPPHLSSIIERSLKAEQSPSATPVPAMETKPRSPEPAAEKPKASTPAAVTAIPESSIIENARKSMQPWIDSAASVRDALVRIPPVPMNFWCGGMIVILFLSIARIWRFRTILNQGAPAHDDIVSMVNQAATQLKLRRVPMTVMTDRALPPMIWCGWPMKLILPAALWNDLDNVGQRAVIMHELAHLKRRDHWVCWISAIIGLVYWWHPIVWWCRRRLREEADFCCDNWVTTLLPRARRAYAHALLTARTSMNETGCPMPAVGLGTSTPRAKKFARRLTMVMTNQTGPRMSRWGFAGVALLGAAAWLAAPLWACPPESSEDGQAAKAKVKVRAPFAVAAPGAVMVAPRMTTSAPLRGVVIESGQVPVAQGANASTFERYMAARTSQPGFAVAGPAQGGVDSRLDALERRLDALTEQLHQLLQGGQNVAPRSHGVGGGAGGMGGGSMSPMARAYSVPAQPRIADAYHELAAAERGATLGMMERSADSDEIIDRVYKLPDGKLEAFTELMARSDVPILIQRQDGAILVHATARQHEIVAAFIAIIDPDGDHGPAARGGAFNSIEPGVRWRTAQGIEGFKQQEMQYKRMAERQAVIAQRMANSAQQRAKIDAARAQSEAFRKQAQEVRDQAIKMRRQADDVRRKAEETRRRSSDASSDEKRQHELDAQADAIEHEADHIDVAADRLDENADRLDEQAEAADEQINDAEEALASATDEAADLDSEMADLKADIDAEAADESDESPAPPEAIEPPVGMELPTMPTLPPTPPAPPTPGATPAPSAPTVAIPASSPPAAPPAPPRGNPM